MEELLITLNKETDALIVVDVQPTFMPGGGLPVAGGDEVVPVIRELMEKFQKRFATLDRHPRGHISLASSYCHALSENFKPKPMQVIPGDVGPLRPARHAKFTAKDIELYLNQVGSQVLWPDHAIESMPEAELHSEFSEDEFNFVQIKGMDPVCDSYSGFYDNLRRPTGLGDVVKDSGAKRLFVCGLAFDFCVGWTVLDALKAVPGIEVFVVKDATRSVGLGDSESEMTRALLAEGIRIIHTPQIS